MSNLKSTVNQIINKFNAKAKSFELDDSPTLHALFYDFDETGADMLNVDWALLEDNIDEVIELDERAKEWANAMSRIPTVVDCYPAQWYHYEEGKQALRRGLGTQALLMWWGTQYRVTRFLGL